MKLVTKGFLTLITLAVVYSVTAVPQMQGKWCKGRFTVRQQATKVNVYDNLQPSIPMELTYNKDAKRFEGSFFGIELILIPVGKNKFQYGVNEVAVICTKN